MDGLLLYLYEFYLVECALKESLHCLLSHIFFFILSIIFSTKCFTIIIIFAAVMLDTKGPEIRSGFFADGAKKITLVKGETSTSFCRVAYHLC